MHVICKYDVYMHVNVQEFVNRHCFQVSFEQEIQSRGSSKYKLEIIVCWIRQCHIKWLNLPTTWTSVHMHAPYALDHTHE